MSRLRVIAAVLAAWITATTPALAQGSPRRFGERRQLVVAADRLMPLVSYTSQAITAVEGDTTTRTTERGGSFAFLVGREPGTSAMHSVPRVAVDVTVLPRLTIGTSFVLAFGLEGTRTEERTPKGAPPNVRENAIPGATLLGFAPRVGYVVPLNDRLAFWPRGGIAFYSMKSQREQTSNTGVTSTSTVTDTLFSLDLDPQLVWTPLPHVLVHAGPLANLPFTGAHETAFAQGPDLKERSDHLRVFHFGVSAGFGAWFDL